MNLLKLIALDEVDLEVISSHLQDAVVRVGDMAYVPSKKRFAALLNRFEWERTEGGNGRKDYRRRRTALRFERVLEAKHKGIRPATEHKVLSLLAIGFEPDEAPSGYVTLTFSGDASIKLKVECIEAALTDLGPAWRTKSKPEHPDAPAGVAGKTVGGKSGSAS
ncbi:DUF2948 family protein [Methyloceanibacter sp.]|uniref:DUF2948 family protein n=1 Tax=Methyloceanibacter sp. TaxID=1965321 RepID=UPI002D6FA0B1|nr:DUF2948 family protein [Methyloceanibacter sp.]HZP09635.1 DUF2948 family protein [Methyloceanibacter sp.]